MPLRGARVHNVEQARKRCPLHDERADDISNGIKRDPRYGLGIVSWSVRHGTTDTYAGEVGHLAECNARLDEDRHPLRGAPCASQRRAAGLADTQ